MKQTTVYGSLIASCLILGLAACSSAQKNNTAKPENTPQQTQASRDQSSYDNPASSSQPASNQSASNAAIVPDQANNTGFANGANPQVNNPQLNSQQAGQVGAQAGGQVASNDITNSPQDLSQSPGQQQKQLGLVGRQEGNTQIPTQKVIVQQTNQNVPTITETKVGADINRMTSADFKALGLSDQESQKVVQYRANNGSFKSVNDLAKVPDLSLSWLASNQGKLAVDQSTG